MKRSGCGGYEPSGLTCPIHLNPLPPGGEEAWPCALCQSFQLPSQEKRNPWHSLVTAVDLFPEQDKRADQGGKKHNREHGADLTVADFGAGMG